MVEASLVKLLWMSLDFTDDQSTLVQVMAWCRQATSHYLSHCWPRPLSPYGVTRPQWVKSQNAITRTLRDTMKYIWDLTNIIGILCFSRTENKVRLACHRSCLSMSNLAGVLGNERRPHCGTHLSLASYQVRTIGGCACAGNAGDVFTATAG